MPVPPVKTDHKHSFGRHISTCLATALVICAAVELTCLSLGIAPFFTPNLPLNEKMRFLRDHRLGPAPVAVVSGASIAVNDIDSDLLEDEEKSSFVNLGANGISVPTAEQFYKQLADIYSVREVIFAASPVELRDAYRSDVQVPTPVFRRYVLGRMTMAEEFTYRDISGLMSYWKNWGDYHGRTSPSSMAFTKTGAVPLEIGPGSAEYRAHLIPVLARLAVDDGRSAVSSPSRTTSRSRACSRASWSACSGASCARATARNAMTSLGKQEPPYPIPGFRNLGPMRESEPTPCTT